MTKSLSFLSEVQQKNYFNIPIRRNILGEQLFNEKKTGFILSNKTQQPLNISIFHQNNYFALSNTQILVHEVLKTPPIIYRLGQFFL